MRRRSEMHGVRPEPREESQSCPEKETPASATVYGRQESEETTRE
jgi:hypothetical protein